MNIIKRPGADKKNNNNQYPDFEESCKRRTRIVKFGITLKSTNRIKGIKKLSLLKKSDAKIQTNTRIIYTKYWYNKNHQ